jgi:hypothetical protein
MGSFRNQPTANAGHWSLTTAEVEIHVLKRGNVKEYRFYIEWLNADGGHNLTLLSDQGFTTRKEAEAHVKSVEQSGFIKVIEAKDYDDDEKAPEQWTKCHASPHPEARNVEFPWGSSMSFKAAAAAPEDDMPF